MSVGDTLRAKTWLRCFFVAVAISPIAAAQSRSPAVPSAPQGELIQPAGHPEIYVLVDGRKYHIETPSWMGFNGFSDAPIHTLTLAEVDAIPEGYPLPEGSGMPGKSGAMALEGRLLTDHEGRIFVVIEGVRHWVLSTRWIEESRYAKQPALHLTEAQLELIPVGGDITYTPLATKLALPLLAIAIFLLLLKASSGRGWANTHNPYVRGALAALFVVAIGFREPYLLDHPRFWAEEGQTWFQYGSTHSIYKTLFAIFPFPSYMNFAANVGAVLSSRTAAHFGLLFAPFATTWYSYLLQALAIAAVFYVPSTLFDSLWKAVAGCSILLFASTTADEVWLNSINLQVFLGAITIVLLFAKTEGWTGWQRWCSRGVLLFCGFSSPYSLALLPLFVVSAWRSKVREQKIHCLLLVLCLFVQANAVVRNHMRFAKAGVDTMRASTVRADASALNILVEHMVYPAAGMSLKEHFIDVTGLKETSVAVNSFSLPRRLSGGSVRAAGWLCCFLIAGILALLRGPVLFSTTNMLIVAFLLLSVFVCVTSLYSVPTGRYAVLPGAIFLLLLLSNIDESHSHLRRLVCMAVLSYGLAAGMVAYRTIRFQEGPSWAGEVKKWQADPKYSMRVWPSYFVPQGSITYVKPQP